MHDAVEALVHDGDTVAIDGFTHLICFAAGHEIIRQFHERGDDGMVEGAQRRSGVSV